MGSRRCCCGPGDLLCNPHCLPGHEVAKPRAIGVTFSGYEVWPHLVPCTLGSGFGSVNTYAYPAADHYAWSLNGEHVLPLRQAIGPGGAAVYQCDTDYRFVGHDTIVATRTRPAGYVPLEITTTYDIYWYARAALETFDSALPNVQPHSTTLRVYLGGYAQNYGDPLPSGVPSPTYAGFGATGRAATFTYSAANPTGHLWDCAAGEELGAFPAGHCGAPGEIGLPGHASSLALLLGSALGESTAPASIAGGACAPANCSYGTGLRVQQLAWPSLRFRLLP